MQIHLADTSGERGQYQCLVQERYTSSLLSYAYRNILPHFETLWRDLVHLHLTDTTGKLGNGFSVKQLLPLEKQSNHLFSYAYNHEQSAQWNQIWNQPPMEIHLGCLPSQNKSIQSQTLPEVDNHLTSYQDLGEVSVKETAWNKMTEQDLRPRVIIDSGAFTAFTSGKSIDPRDYARWALDFQDRWEHRMVALHFMNLDVIGDQDASWQNQSILEGLGMKPLPIITYGSPKHHLVRALENYPYIALGGLVPYTRQKDKLRKWLDFCFNLVMARKKSTGIMPKVHLLGVTTDWVLKRYPCYSSDSSSWVGCLRFGDGKAAGIDKIPRYKDSDAAMAATIHVLRSEIRKFKNMELEATNLWNSRGITFEN